MACRPALLLFVLTLTMTPPIVGEGVHLEASLARAVRPSTRTATVFADPLAAVSKEGGDARPSSTEREFTVPGEMRLDLDPNWLWQVRIEAAGLWTQDQTVRIDSDETALRFRLWPTGRLRGRLMVAERREKLGERVLMARFEGSLQARSDVAIPEATIRCPIEDSAWECELPAGELDMRLRVRGYISHFLWVKPIPTGGVADVGTLTLRSGSSISGWVERVDGAATSPECEARLLPQAGATPAPTEDSRRRLLVDSTRVNDRGFFHLAGVPAGSYVLEVVESGFAPASVFPVQVLERTEVELQEVIVLDYPRTLEVQLEPPQDPWGEPWRVQLFEQTSVPGHEKPVLQHSRDVERGWWQWDGLAARSYRVHVLGSSETAWHTEAIDLAQGDASLPIALKVISLEGQILLGEEPIPADIWFGGRRVAVRVALEADETGRFEGFLPREGTWSVEVVAQEPPVHRFLESVEVTTKDGENEAFVEIVLPDTVLRGSVVDEKGKTPARAYLGVMSLGEMERPFFQPVDSDGTFELLGLAPGRILLLAQAPPDLSTNWVPVEALEGEVPPDVELVLQAGVWLEGRVLSAVGPVAGARIEAGPAHDPLAGVGAIATDVAGQFRARLPPGTTEANLRVYPPGFSMRTLRLPVRPGNPVEIRVDSLGGTLELAISKDVQSGFSAPALVLVHNGAWLGSTHLAMWSVLNGLSYDQHSIIAPKVEPGDYTACWITRRQLPQLNSRALQEESSCVSGYLSAMGRLTLNIE